jgi:type I restriction enzyme S subunit
MTLADVWQLREQVVDVVTQTKEKISELGMANSSAVLHPVGTVFLSRTASVGFSAIMGVPMATSQDFATWTCGRELFSRYLLYALRAMAPDLRRVAAGSTHKTIYMPDIEQLRVPLPPIDEQQRIADFLDAESVRIDRQRAVLARLRSLIREREGTVLEQILTPNGHQMGQCGQLQTDVWRWTPLAHLTQPSRPIMYGIVLPGPNVSDGVPIVKGGDVAARRLRVDSLCRTTREIEASYKRSRLLGGDLVIAIRGSVGEVEVVPDELTGANLTQDAARISVGSAVDGRWLELVLRAPSVARQIQERVTGATIKGINIWDLKRIAIPTPASIEQQVRFACEAGREVSLHEQIISSVDRQSRLLDERRQAVITAAVTGQLDVTTARGVDV